MKGKKIRILALLLVLVMSFAACSSGATSSAPVSESAVGATADTGETELITDMAGREVEVPTEVNLVYCAVPTAEAMLCTLNMDKNAGWVNELAEPSKQFLNDRAVDLPVLGGWMGEKSTANLEEIVKTNPDVIVFCSSLDLNTNTVETADAIQEQTSLPVVVVDSSFYQIKEAYEFFGELIGEAERGKELGAYAQQVKDDITAVVETIPEEEYIRVYYAEGENGLATDPSSSEHALVLDFVGTVNVADDEVEVKSGQGMSPVSFEQVLQWNPEAIVLSGTTATETADAIRNTDPQWAQVQAVQDGAVYVAPAYPFNWFDRPPNVMRVLGVQWMAQTLYPEYFDYDMNEEISEFFEVFFQMDITDEQIEELLAGSTTSSSASTGGSSSVSTANSSASASGSASASAA